MDVHHPAGIEMFLLKFYCSTCVVNNLISETDLEYS